MNNHKKLVPFTSRLVQRWHFLAFGLAVLFISFLIGCADGSQLTNTGQADASLIDALPDAASGLVIEPEAEINEPRHFLVHRIELPPAVEDTVALKGQFEANQPARRARVQRMRNLINPALKLHDGNAFPIVDEDEHLTAYTLRTDNEPVRQVWFENQFGQQTWILGNPRLLYAPAQKEPHEFPDSLDHFKCYDVLNSGGAVDEGVGVSDQFLPLTQTVVREGELFCVPVHKRHGEYLYAINNPIGHLAVYRIDQIPMDPEVRLVKDQFDDRDITALGAVQLIAESRKLAWQEID